MNSIYAGTLAFVLACWLALEIVAVSAHVHWFFVALLASVLALWRCRHSAALQVVCAVVFFGLLGLWAGSRAPAVAAEELQAVYGQRVIVLGSIDPLSVRHGGEGTGFIVRCERLWLAGQELPYRQQLRVFTKAALPANNGRVQLSGRLRALPVLHNPGTFDAARWQRLNGIGGRLDAESVQCLPGAVSIRDAAALLNLQLRQRIEALPGQGGKLLAGMLLGGSAADEGSRELLAANGLSHLLSVSGTHLLLLGGFLNLLFGALPLRLRKMAVGGLLLLYAALCGFRAPVLRALALNIALLCGEGADRGHVLCLTAVVMLLVKPLWLLDIGLQLSFAAAAGLLWLLPRIQAVLGEVLPALAAEAMAVTLAAQLAAVPLLISYFHQLAPVALLSNLLLAPVLEVAALLALLGALAGIVCGLGLSLLQLAGFLVQQILRQAAWLAALPGAVLTVGSLPFYCAAGYYACLGLLLDVPCVRFLSNKARRCALALLLCSGALYGLWRHFAPQPLTAYFLDVGQGDCAVIVTPGRQTLVIDTGGLRNYDTGSRVLAPFLRSLGTDEIAMLLLSHGDYDHVGGAASLSRSITVKKLLLPALVPEEREHNHLERIVALSQETAVSGSRYSCGGAELEILYAPVGEQGNTASVVAALYGRKGRMLFTGDADAAEEESLPLAGLRGCEVLKVAHHGSRYSSSPEFLQRLGPQLAVISVGRGNTYGHPHRESLARLAAAGSTILRTDELGAVKVVFDGERTKWYSYLYQKEDF